MDVYEPTKLNLEPGLASIDQSNIILQSIRDWGALMAEADRYSWEGQWEQALRACNGALHICNAAFSETDLSHYKHETVAYLCFVNRSMGRYEQACAVVEPVLGDVQPGAARAGLYAELAAVYRLMNRLEDAKTAFEKEYAEANQFDLEQHQCRAIGNIGTINHQLFQRDKQRSYLNLAINQLQERVDRARVMKDSLRAEGKTQEYAATLEVIGLSRLSLCYVDSGASTEAITTALESLAPAGTLRDPSVIAMSRFFYGHALLCDGQRQAALEQISVPACLTPAMAFCKEPSTDNLRYLEEISDLGVSFEAKDEHGYSALHYAVFNGHEGAQAIVIESLRKDCGDRVANDLYQDAFLQRGYREIFQDKLRPVLLSRDAQSFPKARRLYAQALAADSHMSVTFDALKFVRYQDLRRLGRFPRLTDGLTHDITLESSDQTVGFMIFLSYRWINSNPWTLRSTPDNAENTQYRRTIEAIDHVCLRHPSVNVETLGIWIDFACIDQENPSRGIAALPMVIAQCDALISLVDDEYHTRAWCSVEVMMIQSLRKAYSLHGWYEHIAGSEPDSHGLGTLREGAADFAIDLATKRLRFEEDRSKVAFLERQCKLLC